MSVILIRYSTENVRFGTGSLDLCMRSVPVTGSHEHNLFYLSPHLVALRTVQAHMDPVSLCAGHNLHQQDEQLLTLMHSC